MLRRVFAIGLLILLTLSCLKAQRGFVAGVVITLNNDSLKGYIQNNDLSIYSKCFFKKALNEEAVTYRPSDIKGFKLDNGKYYITKKVASKNDSAVYFLEFLIKGKASMFFMRDDMDHYYIEMDDNKRMIELTQRQIIVNNDSVGDYFVTNKYKGKLKALFNNNVGINSEIERTKLNHSSLIRLAKNYHNLVCNTYQCTVFEKPIVAMKFRFGIHAALGYNTYKLGANFADDNVVTPLAGARIELEHFTNSIENLSLVADFDCMMLNNVTLKAKDGSWVKDNSTIYFLTQQQSPAYNARPTLDVDLKTLALKIPICLHYTFANVSMKPYVGVGVSSMMVLAQNKNLTVTNSELNNETLIPDFNIGFVVKAGANYTFSNQAAVYGELGFEYLNNDIKVSQYAFTQKGIEIKVGYKF